MASRRVAKIFYQTSLNYDPTVQFFQKYGVKNVDMDWIPKCFPYYNQLIRNGLDIFLHLYLVPVTITRKCHTARLLGEKKFEECSRSYRTRAFMLKNNSLGIKLFLSGNAIFKVIKPSRKELKKMSEIGISELVTPLNPILKIENSREINGLISGLSL